MKKLAHYASLLTINGQCLLDNPEEKFCMTNRIPPPLANKPWCSVRKIRNFFALHLPCGIDLMIYSRGGFKVTIKNSKRFMHILHNIEWIIECTKTIMKKFYQNHITDVKCRFTQLVSILKWDYNLPSDYVWDYNRLISCNKQHNADYLIWTYSDLIFKHSINWMMFEDGTSSIFINIFHQTTKIGGFKLFTNLKIVIFTYKILYLSRLVETIPHFIKNSILTDT